MNAKLFWDESGQTACEQHGPYRGSDTWISGRWRAITLNERIDFAAEVGRQPTCETCDAILRRHAEGRHAEKPSNECARCSEVAS